jgi:hypothetical protein
MALTLTSTEHFISIALDGSTDFNSSTDLVSLGLSKNPTDGLSIKRIIFLPSAVSDKLVVRDGSLTGPAVFATGAVPAAYNICSMEYSGFRMVPCIKASECTIGTPGSGYVVFEI